jgi:hypothetical protein
MAAPVTVYGPVISPAVARVAACLLEKDVPFQIEPVDMSKGEHKSPSFLKLQPFGQVPAFKDHLTTVFGTSISHFFFFFFYYYYYFCCISTTILASFFG